MCGVKDQLRRQLIGERKSMDPELRRKADEDIFQQLRPVIDEADSVFTYASAPIEVDTRKIIHYCLEKKIPVALPVSGESDMKFYYIRNLDELKPGRYGIDEPSVSLPAVADRKTLCIVPALCADEKGFRLGYGKGYYDRFLANFIGKAIVICYSGFKRKVPVEPHDIKADFTIFDRI